MSNKVKELPEDIEVVGPGQMLAEARKNLGLSQKDVAVKLNFRVALVDDIEHELFDKSLPDTFNRGYLKNYAKLVGVSEQEVLSSYEMLGIADKQRTEMQSFSKITEKQAQNSRLMWVTYLILAAFFMSSIFYYLQNLPTGDVVKADIPAANTQLENNDSTLKSEVGSETQTKDSIQEAADNSLTTELSKQLEPAISVDVAEQARTSTQAITINESQNTNEQTLSDVQQVSAAESVAIFTFAGDCWVNIYDGNNERIAWGIKKAGYVMELKGLAPFKVTVGKPELVAIDFNGTSIDMSKFNLGNIAKFTLPESP